jgi:hypothetical protein
MQIDIQDVREMTINFCYNLVIVIVVCIAVGIGKGSALSVGILSAFYMTLKEILERW